MTVPYFLAPFIGWLTSGTLKYIINRIRFGDEAKSRAGNGGFPSTHTTTLFSTAMLIGYGEGFMSAVFGLAVAITFIVVIDATGLRIAVGKQAGAINRLAVDDASHQPLREQMGHTWIEILGGVVVGAIVGSVLYVLFGWIGWMPS